MYPFNTTRRSLAVGTAIVAVFAAAATCSHDRDPDYQGVCVENSTGERTPDSECTNTAGHTHGFLFFPVGFRYPGIGQNATGMPGAVATVPDGHTGVRGGAAPDGGLSSRAGAKSAVTRGGFGTTSQGHGWSVGG